MKLWTGGIFGSERVEQYVALVKLLDALEKDNSDLKG